MSHYKAIIILLTISVSIAQAQDSSRVSMERPIQDSLTLYYDIGVHDLSESQQNSVAKYLDILDRKYTYQFAIVGYADYLGSAQSNEQLAQERAATLHSYIQKKIPSQVEQVTYKGLGELPAESLSGNLSKDGVPEDRKVVLYVEGKPTPIPFVAEQLSEKPLTELSTFIPGEKVILEGLNFKPGLTQLLKSSIPVAYNLKKILLENPTVKVEISGHVCCSEGKEKEVHTIQLAAGRAKNIYTFLVRGGVDSTRLFHRGYGFDRPLIFPELNEEDRIKNRRVELLVIE